MTPESTEPRTAAQMSNEELIEQYSVAMTREPWGHPPHRKQRQLLRAELLRRLATIAPDEPGRVVIDAQRLREIITSYLTPGSWPLTIHTAKDRDSWVGGIMANIERIAAAERAATGGA